LKVVVADPLSHALSAAQVEALIDFWAEQCRKYGVEDSRCMAVLHAKELAARFEEDGRKAALKAVEKLADGDPEARAVEFKFNDRDGRKVEVAQ
jgi:hypothetical protein